MIKLPLKSKTTNYVYLILLATLLVLGVIDAFSLLEELILYI